MTKLAAEPFDIGHLVTLIGGLTLLVVFVFVERRHPAPSVELSLFGIPAMTPTLLATLLQNVGSFAVLFLVIMYLQGPRGLDPIDASLLMVPGYVIGAAIGPYAGRLADRFGVVKPAVAGLGLSVVALAVFAQMTTTSTLWLPIVGNVAIMVGGGFFYAANSAAVMKSAPPSQFGLASGLMRTAASTGMVFSFTTAILVAATAIPRSTAFAVFVGTATLEGRDAEVFIDGLSVTFYTLMAVIGLAAVFSAIRRPGRNRAGEPDSLTADGPGIAASAGRSVPTMVSYGERY